MSVRDLPALNAILNATSAALLEWGWVLIRRGEREKHRRVMLAAFTTSVLFLASYLTSSMMSTIPSLLHKFCTFCQKPSSGSSLSTNVG